jgi:hypothetical protein
MLLDAWSFILKWRLYGDKKIFTLGFIEYLMAGRGGYRPPRTNDISIISLCG